VAGLGNTGRSHAPAHHRNPGLEIVSLVNRSAAKLADELAHDRVESSFAGALQTARPDLAFINTCSDTHTGFAVKAIEAGCHAFVKAPPATAVGDALRVVDCAKGDRPQAGHRLHPAPPPVLGAAYHGGKGARRAFFRMKFDQQSSGATWQAHKQLVQTTSPIVDCGVHR
jgi:hypothetical protein